MKTILLILLLSVPCFAGERSPEYQQILREAAARRHRQIQRHNYAQAEAQRMVSQGLRSLTRPADPWNIRPYYPAYRYPRVYRYPIYRPYIRY